MSQSVLLEVCVASVDDAVAAARGGADRLELNCALALGGLTPSAGLFAEVRKAVAIPIIAMVRPRQGGFCYTSTEFDVMMRDAESLLQAGADGLAFGVLTDRNEVDVDRNRRLVELCGPREAVFHRAFDLTRDPLAALEQIIALGFKRLMTSGQERTALAGVELIAEVVRLARGRIEVLPASGIHPEICPEIITKTGCDQLHASLRRRIRDIGWPEKSGVRFHSEQPVAEDTRDVTDGALVARLRAELNGELFSK